ncbi:hypothetical protein MFIFM68171_03476 [Madurella fahalii]|uniref:Cytochrome b561 domain-containing protein n=1 Tax=Madurella fahalii TaxID=1157608 RepID=A0ABQ0G664_9PEZI
MASQEPRQPALQGDNPAPTESEPLLGRPGDATQKPNEPMVKNLWLGTGWLAQAGAVALLAIVWVAVFTHPRLPLVSPHPLLQSLGLFVATQAVLLLQPTTHTFPTTKVRGQRGHFALHVLSFLLFAAGTAVIETNKHVNGLAHFHSLHAYLGVTTATLLFVQYLFGVSIWLVPAVWGGLDKAKQLWRYHRYFGYAVLVLLLATVASAAETDYSKAVLGIKLWSVLVAEVLIVAGVFPRVQLSKFGIQRP